MSAMGDRLLSVDNLAVQFGRAPDIVEAVRDVSLSVGAGEKVALVGESGSGKSVTALSILRLHDSAATHYRSGRIQFDGRDILQEQEGALHRIRGREIAMIFQEPMTSLNPVYTIGAQLIEPLMVHEGVSKAVARTRMVELLHRTGIPDPEKRFDAFPHMLSGGQRQRVMIAMALACKPKLLIADEPTTALDVTIQAQILNLLDDLQREFGMAVLMISHDLNVVRRFADRVYVMQAGTVVEHGPTRQLFAAPQHPYTRKLLESQPERLAPQAPPRDDKGALLSAQAVYCSFPIKAGFFRRQIGEVKAVDNVSLTVHRGETVGIVGESGSGKSTLGMCVLRLQSCRGEIAFDGQRIESLSPRALRPLRRHFQVVFQDPYSSLSPRMTVEQIVGEGLEIHFPALTAVERHRRIVATLLEVGLNEDSLWRYPHEFSGGQRQRIAIARVVILEPKLILLDEPTSALDVSVQKQILELLLELQQRRQMSYLFISHDLKVVRAMAHRVLVMRNGQVVEAGDTETIFTSPQHDYTRALLTASLFAA